VLGITLLEAVFTYILATIEVEVATESQDVITALIATYIVQIVIVIDFPRIHFEAHLLGFDIKLY
jgi:hypothetical protein